MASHIKLLLTLLAVALFASAQQPTPFIPATHYSIIASQTSRPNPQLTKTGATASLPTTHFFPQIDATFRYPNTNTNSAGDASSVWQALSSVQSTWTAGAEYAKITAAIYEVAPQSARSSLSVSGYNWDRIVQEPWYSDVDNGTQALVLDQEETLQETFDSMVSEAHSISSGSAGQMSKGVGMGIGTLFIGAMVLSLLAHWIEL